MEALIERGLVAGVLDVTTTELADELVGGVLSAGPDRLEAAGAARASRRSSPWARWTWSTSARADTVPARFADRTLYVHNPTRDADAHDAGGVRRAGPPDRREAVGRHRAGRGLRPAARGVAARRPRAAVPRPGGGRGAVRRAAVEPGAATSSGTSSTPTSTTRGSPTPMAARAATRYAATEAGSERGQARHAGCGPTLADGGTIIGAGAGTGLSAKCAEAGGADLIIIYNSGRYRMAGRGSLAGLMPYGDANAIVMEMARGGAAGRAGARPSSPACAAPTRSGSWPLPRRGPAAGFAGVQNFPTVGLIDGVFRAEPRGDRHGLRAGGGDDRRWPPSAGLLTAPYVFDDESAEAMARAGADVLVPHMGLTTKGSIGARTALTLDDCVARVQADARRRGRRQPRRHRAVPRRPDRRAGRRRSTCSTGRAGSSGSSAPPAWSACRPSIALTENMRRFKAIHADQA